MSTGYKVFAIIELDDRDNISVDLRDNKYKIERTIDGKICIVEKETTEYCKIGKIKEDNNE